MTIISYAQNFEDVRLWRAFSDVTAGRYLDIGTQDPVQDSVSLAFYERGWRGVHVEPTPSYAAALRRARPDETVIEAAVSVAPGPLRFFEIPETGLSTGNRQIAERHEASGWKCREILVPTVTLAGIFDIMGSDLIHWMKIDVEGMEADVLTSWGNHAARPAVLVIEATEPGTQNPTHQAWHELVTRKGYVDVLFDGLSRYFVHESHAARSEALALSPNVFDGYQVHPGHFAANHLARKHEAEVAETRREILEERDRRVSAISEQLLTEQAQHAEIVANCRQSTESALAEVERHRSALEQQTEAHSIALGEAIAAARQLEEQLEASQQEIDNLKRQVVAEADAHFETRERAAASAIEAAVALESTEAQLAALQEKSAESVRSHTIALSHAENAAETNARAHAEATARLNALQQDHLSLVRENGRLEGRIDAQNEAHAARLADADMASRQLADRLARSEELLRRAQADVIELRSELALQARENDAALASSERRLALSSETLVKANAERERLVDEIEAVRQQCHSEVAGLHDKLTELQHHIRWREEQLRNASSLLDDVPGPLAGLPRIVAALVRPWMSATTLAAIANHRTDLDNFRSNLLLPPAPDLSHGAQISLVDPTVVASAGIEHRGAQNMEGDGPVTSVPRLLAPHDREFIRTAYQAVLGRAPDPEGEAYYLARLRAGTHKLAILKQLRRSSEGRNFIPGVAGLDRAIKRHVWATLPILGTVVRMITGTDGNGATHRHLRILANEIGRGRTEQASVVSRLDHLATIVQHPAACPVVVADAALTPTASSQALVQSLSLVQPPSFGPGQIPVTLDSQERRVLGSLRLLAFTRGAPA
jgi:FkbM family methyltransferase